VQTKKITYLNSPGRSPGNAEITLRAALERANELGIRDVVVASHSGTTGVKACEVLKGLNVIIVTHHVGFREPGVNQLTEENERKIKELGGKILTCTHALSGVESAIRSKWNTIGPVEIIADALRIFGDGAKVCAEIVVMAADAGLIPIDKDVIAVAGAGGADTAVVAMPVHSKNFFDMTIREIVCKPRTRVKDAVAASLTQH
jgi:hypothetical protein